ncbi:AI-2E family transporter [Halorussus salilacus]|uniref:AI-2E family transporter n=1 Tax=Halorussus salilacus TaxID=2953750 RepID=UPI00209C840F|nr:AI-2E family transporter [Halorussus salilacus]USZ67739.1 AI-2E family transporter [Halorussus salilacus]
MNDWDIDRARIAWWAVGLALASAVAYVVYSFVGTFVFGIFLYYATRPVYQRLRRRIGPPSVAAAVSLFALALPVLLLVMYTAAIGLQELARAFDALREMDAVPADLTGVWEQIEPYVGASTIAQRPEDLLDDPNTELIQDVGMAALEYIGIIGIGLLHLFVMIAIAFYLLRDDHRLSRYVQRQFADSGGVFAAYVRAVDRDFNSVFFGNILNALFTGTIGAAAYNVVNLVAPTGLGVPYPTLIGLLAGAASLIPVVGMKLVYFPVLAYLFAETWVADPGLLWFPALFFAVSFVVVDTIPDLVLRPYVSGRDLHVGMVMLAYILGPLLFGWYGIFLGPLILVLVIHFVRIVLPELVAGEPIRPWAVDPTYLFEHAEPAGESAGPPADSPAGTDGGAPDSSSSASERESSTFEREPSDGEESGDATASPDSADETEASGSSDP